MGIGTFLKVLGSAFDIAGVVLLFLYWLPRAIDFGGIDQRQYPASIRVQAGAKIGLSFLIIGFAFQISGALCAS